MEYLTMKFKSFAFALTALLFVSVAFVGCTGGSITVKADNLEYPASMTEGLYTKDLKLIDNTGYTVVNSFEFSTTKWSIFFGAIPLHGALDLSSDLNEIIKANNGDGIVNLQVGSNVPLYNACNLILLVGPVIIPSSMNIAVKGDVIQYKKK